MLLFPYVRIQNYLASLLGTYRTLSPSSSIGKHGYIHDPTKGFRKCIDRSSSPAYARETTMRAAFGRLDHQWP